ncbi:sarcosine oxidase subunit gamma [Roseivivax sediminis]|uniref:Sarcosine oxidase subunit gamma n=1 Tax=Roseivivax sediminis TaxID=936889 RepID=A0A1I1WCB4_9RHOB|nr:sarcosine oxidase subunit gamma [Roseivivax sediminis]SFD92629.1 sarcosine oxidase subunit gamma [Roseivivax sediminis]
MHDLAPLTPLGAAKPRTDTIGDWTLTEVTDRALASVAARLGREEEAARIVADLLGAEAPAPSRLSGGEIAAFWSGPDQWMIEAPLKTHEALAAQLSARAGGAISVTEQTDAWCRFDLTGPDLPRVLERLCPVDVHRLVGGEAIRTTMEHMGCFLICRTPVHVSILGPRSSAGSLHHALETAMRAAK